MKEGEPRQNPLPNNAGKAPEEVGKLGKPGGGQPWGARLGAGARLRVDSPVWSSGESVAADILRDYEMQCDGSSPDV